MKLKHILFALHKLILVIIIIFSACTPIQNNIRSWNKVDTAYQVAAMGITAVDLLQTHSMAKADWYFNGRTHTDICPFFGRRPHQDTVDILIPAGMLLHTTIAVMLPPEAVIMGYKVNPRRIWQIVFTGIELGAVVNNFNHGARIEF